MSEVAVKIYETKRNVQRFHLTTPLRGENGAKQKGTWVDSDTGKEVTGYTYPTVGHYSMETTIIGVHTASVIGPFQYVDGEMEVGESTVLCNDGRLSVYQSRYFVTGPALYSPLVGLENLVPDTVIDRYYCVLRFLDE